MTTKQHKFSRLEKVIGKDNLDILSKKSVLILGCGGVGGYVAEALARSNVGTLILVDFDDINDKCKVLKIKKYIDLDNYIELFDYDIDFFVDACDTVSVKKAVIKECINRNISMISSMGTGNKLDPSKLEIVDIRKTVNDPLARIIRKFE